MKNDYYVYLHLDCASTAFYVGKGRLRRAYESSGRSARWNNKAKDGYTVSIIASNLTEKEALDLEIELLSEYHDLVNYHSGAKSIAYSKEEYSEYFKIDPDSPSYLSRVSGVWTGTYAKGKIGPCGFKRKRVNREHWGVKFKNDTVPVHRIIWTLMNGEIPGGYVIDHINGNALDNSPGNLRMVSQELNTRNKKKTAATPFTKAGISIDNFSVKARVVFNDLAESKRFSISKHGLLPAFALACQWREDKIKELNEQGAGYTERHGT